jgi:hypothetical protein
MPETPHSTTESPRPAIYQIRVKGHLAARWATWFGDLTMTREPNGETALTGPIVDQAALHGVLTKIRDLGLPLISVMECDPTQPDGPDGNTDTGSNQETKP